MSEPAYITKLLAMLAAGELPTSGVHVITVEHDDWCAIHRGEPRCDCDPDIQAERHEDAQ